MVRILQRIAVVLMVMGIAVLTARADDPKPETAEGPSLHEPINSAAPQEFPYLTGDWGGTRRRLAEKGITFDIDTIVDVTKNLKGGLGTAGSTWRRLTEATFTLDTRPLFGLEGGIVFADFQNADGRNPSDTLIGDVQGIDGLDGVPGAPHQNRTQLAQFWYQQSAFDGALRIKVGKVDANNEFDHSDTAQEFLHQSTGSSATLFTLPTYPDPATSVNIFVKPWKEFQIGFGLYDGSYADGVRTGSLGPRTFFRNAGDLFVISEVDLSWSAGADALPGRLGVGGWYSTNRFARLDGGRRATGTGAPYALLDQTLWRANPKDEKDARGLAMFLMYGYADPAILIYDHNLGGGVAWTGPIPGRPDDVMGTGVQAVHFSRAYRTRSDFEASYEMFYRVQVTPWLALKPDLQYIASPGGRGTPDALALTVRLEMHF
jgi:porin